MHTKNVPYSHPSSRSPTTAPFESLLPALHPFTSSCCCLSVSSQRASHPLRSQPVTSPPPHHAGCHPQLPGLAASPSQRLPTPPPRERTPRLFSFWFPKHPVLLQLRLIPLSSSFLSPHCSGHLPSALQEPRQAEAWIPALWSPLTLSSIFLGASGLWPGPQRGAPCPGRPPQAAGGPTQLSTLGRTVCRVPSCPRAAVSKVAMKTWESGAQNPCRG